MFIGPICKEWMNLKVCDLIHSTTSDWDFLHLTHNLPNTVILLIRSISLSQHFQQSAMDYPAWPYSKGFCSTNSTFVAIWGSVVSAKLELALEIKTPI